MRVTKDAFRNVQDLVLLLTAELLTFARLTLPPTDKLLFVRFLARQGRICVPFKQDAGSGPLIERLNEVLSGARSEKPVLPSFERRPSPFLTTAEPCLPPRDLPSDRLLARAPQLPRDDASYFQPAPEWQATPRAMDTKADSREGGDASFFLWLLVAFCGVCLLVWLLQGLGGPFMGFGH